VSAKQLWLAYSASVGGRILIDAGAVRAITDRKKSLLLVGVTGVEGEFGPGQVVEVIGPDGKMVARGLAGYSAADIANLKGLSLAQIAEQAGPDHAHEAIHRDDLVTHARARRPN
jgi:glutamate 5-kinase